MSSLKQRAPVSPVAPRAQPNASAVTTPSTASDKVVLVALGVAAAVTYYKYDEMRATRSSYSKYVLLFILFCLCAGVGFKAYVVLHS